MTKQEAVHDIPQAKRNQSSRSAAEELIHTSVLIQAPAGSAIEQQIGDVRIDARDSHCFTKCVGLINLDVIQVVLLDRSVSEGLGGRLQHHPEAVCGHRLIPGILCGVARCQGVPVIGCLQVTLLELDSHMLTPGNTTK